MQEIMSKLTHDELDSRAEERDEGFKEMFIFRKTEYQLVTVMLILYQG